MGLDNPEYVSDLTPLRAVLVPYNQDNVFPLLWESKFKDTNYLSDVKQTTNLRYLWLLSNCHQISLKNMLSFFCDCIL